MIRFLLSPGGAGRWPLHRACLVVLLAGRDRSPCSAGDGVASAGVLSHSPGGLTHRVVWLEERFGRLVVRQLRRVCGGHVAGVPVPAGRVGDEWCGGHADARVGAASGFCVGCAHDGALQGRRIREDQDVAAGGPLPVTASPWVVGTTERVRVEEQDSGVFHISVPECAGHDDLRDGGVSRGERGAALGGTSAAADRPLRW